MASETDNVKVFVRTRPINQREVEMGEQAMTLCLDPINHARLCRRQSAYALQSCEMPARGAASMPAYQHVSCRCSVSARAPEAHPCMRQAGTRWWRWWATGRCGC